MHTHINDICRHISPCTFPAICHFLVTYHLIRIFNAYVHMILPEDIVYLWFLLINLIFARRKHFNLHRHTKNFSISHLIFHRLKFQVLLFNFTSPQPLNYMKFRFKDKMCAYIFGFLSLYIHTSRTYGHPTIHKYKNFHTHIFCMCVCIYIYIYIEREKATHTLRYI